MPISSRVNRDYLKVFKEPMLFLSLTLRHYLRSHSTPTPPTTLIVVVGLIGEFAASIPAIRAYIRNHPEESVDLLVSAPLADIARHITGVRSVFVAQSVFARENEREVSTTRISGTYRTLIALRMSADAYRALAPVTARALRTGFLSYLWYGITLLGCLLTKQRPRTWASVAFTIVGETPTTLSYNEIFTIPEKEYEPLRALPELNTRERKVVIHTGATWSANRWHLDHWVALIKKIKEASPAEVIVIGSERDQSDYDYIARQVPVVSLVGRLSLFELMLTLRLCDLCIAVDSGPRNVAHLVELPSVTLLGPGPHMFTPPDPRDCVLDHSQGRGLWQRFFNTSENTFIEHITPEEVFAAVTSLSGRIADSSIERRV